MSETLPKVPNLFWEAICKYSVEVINCRGHNGFCSVFLCAESFREKKCSQPLPQKILVFLQQRERNGKAGDVEFCQALV